MTRTFKVRWYNARLGEWVEARARARSWADAIDKINSQYDASIQLETYKSRKRAFAGGRQAILETA